MLPPKRNWPWMLLVVLALNGVGMSTAVGYPILGDISFRDGARWELVAVSLHNYAPVPQQQRYKTFVVRDARLLEEIKQGWDFPLMFEDVCEYHYALKLYRDGQLMRTLLVNLRCNYITLGNFSYRFDPQLFEPLAAQRVNLPWSHIDYRSVDRIRAAWKRLRTEPRVYFYQDPTPYFFDGYFLYGSPHQPLTVNPDSLRLAIAHEVAGASGQPPDSVHVLPHYFNLTEENRLFFRFFVYCSSHVGEAYRHAHPDRVRIRWRSHFAMEEEITLVVVGVNEERYRQLLGE